MGTSTAQDEAAKAHVGGGCPRRQRLGPDRRRWLGEDQARQRVDDDALADNGRAARLFAILPARRRGLGDGEFVKIKGDR